MVPLPSNRRRSGGWGLAAAALLIASTSSPSADAFAPSAAAAAVVPPAFGVVDVASNSREKSPRRSSRSSSSSSSLSMARSGTTATATATAAPPSSSRRNPNKKKKKKSVRDRTRQEAVDLLKDLIRAAAEAGPRAGPARTLQAYLAVANTARDFLPPVPVPPGPSVGGPFGGGGGNGSGNGSVRGGEEFSAPVALRKLFERLGATYVKLGQFVASSPTLFPREYVTEFQKCLDATEPLDWKVVESAVERELGPISRTFSYVDRKPLASASIAQVHAARLLTGEDVVIKVQKPGIDESLKADLSFVYVASRVLEFLQPDWERTSLSAIAGDVRKSMLEELDFEKEATNLEEFREFLTRNGLEGQATAPRVYREFTTKRVLTMERLRGVSMLDSDSISRITGGDPELAIVTALNVWTTSVVTMPWFHADVHAGNLLMLEDGRVGFIDFGIVGRVGERVFGAVNDLSAALAMADYEGMAAALCAMGAADEDVDTVKFGEDIRNVVENLGKVQTDIAVGVGADGSVAGRIDFDENEITQVLLDIVDVTEDNGLKLPREFGLLVKQSLYFDRYLKILAPELDVMGDARVAGLGGEVNGQRRLSAGTGDENVVVDV